MDRYDLLEGKILPWRYSLSPTTSGIQITVGPATRDATETFFHEHSKYQLQIKQIQKSFGLPLFQLPQADNWGFYREIETQANGWHVCFPPKPSPAAKATEANWHAQAYTNISLHFLFSTLNYLKLEDDPQKRQLIIIDNLSISQHNCGGWGIYGACSAEFVNWVAAYPAYHFTEAEEAMRQIDRRLYGPANITWYLAIHRKSRLTLDVGSSTSVFFDPVNYTSEKFGARMLANHNVDAPYQQLTLLSGLAALEELARYQLVQL